MNTPWSGVGLGSGTRLGTMGRPRTSSRTGRSWRSRGGHAHEGVVVIGHVWSVGRGSVHRRASPRRPRLPSEHVDLRRTHCRAARRHPGTHRGVQPRHPTRQGQPRRRCVRGRVGHHARAGDGGGGRGAHPGRPDDEAVQAGGGRSRVSAPGARPGLRGRQSRPSRRVASRRSTRPAARAPCASPPTWCIGCDRPPRSG